MYFKKDILAPFNLIIIVWSIVILTYIIYNPYYEVVNRFDFCILVWTFIFFISALISYKIKLPKIQWPFSIRDTANPRIIKIYILISFLSMPYILYKTFENALAAGSSNIFLYLRMMNTGLDETIDKLNLGVLPYFIGLLLIVYLIKLSERNSKKIILSGLLLLNLLITMLSMSKLSLFVILSSSLMILLIQKRISVAKAFIGFIGFILLSIAIQALRSATGDVSVDFFSGYLLSGMVAFDYFEPTVSINPIGGDHVFRFFYAFMNSFGADFYVQNTILDYTSIPNQTNVYTVMHPYFNDFGYTGLFVFAIINGAIVGGLYRKSKTSMVYLIVYSLFGSFILVQCLGDFVVMNLSTTIQYLFYAVIPFIKFNK